MISAFYLFLLKEKQLERKKGLRQNVHAFLIGSLFDSQLSSQPLINFVAFINCAIVINLRRFFCYLHVTSYGSNPPRGQSMRKSELLRNCRKGPKTPEFPQKLSETFENLLKSVTVPLIHPQPPLFSFIREFINLLCKMPKFRHIFCLTLLLNL